MSGLSLIPPVVVFIVGFWTKKIRLALFLGVLTAAFIASGFAPIDSLILTFGRLFENSQVTNLVSLEKLTSSSNLLIMLFVLSLGVLIEMIRLSDSANAFVSFAEKSVKSKKSAETGSLILSHCLSMDDYLSSLTVGSVLRPLTDRFKIPRIKLAFLTDSMAAPLTMLTPISSWAAAILGFLTENGVGYLEDKNTLVLASPYSLYLNILPYVFYSIALVIAVWVIVRKELSFGLMNDHETLAQSTGDLLGGKKLDFSIAKGAHLGGRDSRLLDFFIPIGSLLLSMPLFLLYCGGFFLMGGQNDFLVALRQAPISLVLFLSGMTSLIVSSFYFRLSQKFYGKDLLKVYRSGIWLMLPVNAILLLAWTMGGLLRQDLQTGQWIASLIADSVPLVLLPLILFWNATIISLALGSSWATAAILFPIAIPMVMGLERAAIPSTIEELPILLPVFGAILSGAVCGDHISLISDTTIMATSSSGSDLWDHVKSQGFYALPIFAGSSFAFLAAGFLSVAFSPMQTLLISMGVAISISLSLLFIMHYLNCKKSDEALVLNETE